MRTAGFYWVVWEGNQKVQVAEWQPLPPDKREPGIDGGWWLFGLPVALPDSQFRVVSERLQAPAMA